MSSAAILVLGGGLMAFGLVKLSGLRKFHEHVEEQRLWCKDKGLPFNQEDDRPRFEASQDNLRLQYRLAIGAGIVCLLGGLM